MKVGLPSTIINESDGENLFLYFSHQSFQEYLAAEYISQADNKVKQVLSEKWNPKWKEVIKFIVSIRGEEIIRTILDEKDNLIHSKLFLSAELTSEVANCIKLKEDITKKIEQLPEYPFFYYDALKCLACVNEAKAIDKIITNIVAYKRAGYHKVDYCFDQLKNKLSTRNLEEHINALLKIAESENTPRSVRTKAIDVLGKLNVKISNEVVSNLINIAQNKNNYDWLRSRAISALWKSKIEFTENIKCNLLKIIVDKSDETSVRRSAIYAITKLNNENVKLLIDIGSDLEEDGDLRSIAIEGLGELMNKTNHEVVNFLLNVARHKNEDLYVRKSALNALFNLNVKVCDEIIEDFIYKTFEIAENTNECDESISLLQILYTLNIHLNNTLIDKLLTISEDYNKNFRIREAAIFLLGQLKGRVNEKISNSLLEIAEGKGKNQELVCGALDALCNLKIEIKKELIEKFINKITTVSYEYLLLQNLYKEGKLVFLERN